MDYWSRPGTDIVYEVEDREDAPEGCVPATPAQIEAHKWAVAGMIASPEAIGKECETRIFAVASRNCQVSMLSERDTFTPDEEAAYVLARDWVAAMKSASRALVAARDTTFADDSHWPACPPEAAALAARF
ncbi:MAG: hypothetical protein QM651_08005 [Rhodoblastus sp.]